MRRRPFYALPSSPSSGNCPPQIGSSVWTTPPTGTADVGRGTGSCDWSIALSRTTGAGIFPTGRSARSKRRCSTSCVTARPGKRWRKGWWPETTSSSSLRNDAAWLCSLESVWNAAGVITRHLNVLLKCLFVCLFAFAVSKSPYVALGQFSLQPLIIWHFSLLIGYTFLSADWCEALCLLEETLSIDRRSYTF